VVFNNYASNIYGKQNNKWILSDSVTGAEILNVKSTPYFIYTFTTSGNYTIYNSVEDSFGNVYATTRPGYIEVIDHKVKRPDDRNPDAVDSFDYGQPEPFYGRDYQAQKLDKDLMIEQQRIFKSGVPPFGTQVIIPGNPDATFRSE
jgi:PKD repeat protein